MLEFDFVPADTTVSFRYVFGSDEYNEFVDSGFNDVFGFFVDGVNCATVPETDTAVSIDRSMAGTRSGENASHSDLYRNNESPTVLHPSTRRWTGSPWCSRALPS